LIKERKMNPTFKQGWKTTEFWVSTILGGLSMLSALGIIGPSEGDYVRGHIQAWAMAASAIIAFGYNLSRAIAKHHWAQAGQLIEGEVTQFTGGVPSDSLPDGL
jgi:hypothetical protein